MKLSHTPKDTNQASSLPLGSSSQRVFTDYPSIILKVLKGIESGMVRILFTDVDSTLILGSGHAESDIKKSHSDAKRLISKLNDENTIIIPITGSHFDSATSTTDTILSRIDKGILPSLNSSRTSGVFCVDAFVTDGGARAIHAGDGGLNIPDINYSKSWSEHEIDYDTLLRSANIIAESTNSLGLSNLQWNTIASFDPHHEKSRIFMQTGTKNGQHRQANKVAFYFYAQGLDERDLIELQFKKSFESQGLRIVCCEEKDANTNARRLLSAESANQDFPLKYCLDIVPYNKATPVDYFADYVSNLIAEQAALNGTSSRPIVEIWACGDASNDLPMLNSQNVSHSVIVGGASAELVRGKHLLESAGKKVYLETNKEVLGPASIIAALNTLK